MNEFILSCGSTVDLNPEHLKKRNLHVMNFRFMVDNIEYVDDFGKTLSYEELYVRFYMLILKVSLFPKKNLWVKNVQ